MWRRCSAVTWSPRPSPAAGTVHIRASKTDQLGAGRHAKQRAGHARRGRLLTWRRPGHASGPLFRRVLRGDHSSAKPLRADSIRKIVRERVAAVVGVAGRIGGHSLQVGSARVAECCSRPAAGGRSVRRRSTLGREAAARWRRTTGGATGVKACRPAGGSSGRRRRRGSESSRHDGR